MLVRSRIVAVLENRKPCVFKEMEIWQKTEGAEEAGKQSRWLMFTSRPTYYLYKASEVAKEQ
jgi:hypothetical protein